MHSERSITPVLRYRDPTGAAEWLCRAFGFNHDHTSEGPSGEAHYISLRLGDCFVLVCPVGNFVLHDLMVQPAEVGGANTQMCYVTVQDLDAHITRALAAGARIELGPEDDGAGGRFYMCRDPEGHLWSIGTRTHGEQRAAAKPTGRCHTAQQLAPVATVLLVLAGWLIYATNDRIWSQTTEVATPSPLATPDQQIREAMADELARRIQAEVIASETAQKLEQEKAASARVGQDLQRAQADLAHMRTTREEAERALANARSAREAADRAAQAAADALALEQTRTKSALEVQTALLSKTAQLGAALLAEKELRVKAESEAQALRERGVQPPLPTNSQPAETASAPPQKEEVEPRDSTSADALASLPPPDGTQSGPISACALAIQGKVPFGRKGAGAWEPANIARLCRNAETSVEPVRCFDQLMRGQVDWGGSKIWMPSNAIALCAGTRDASQTVNCFVKTVAADNPWRSAIDRCRSN